MLPDFGLMLLESGAESDTVINFYDFRFYSITAVGPNLFTTMVNMPVEGELYALSLDFDWNMLLEILESGATLETVRAVAAWAEGLTVHSTLELPEPICVGVSASLGQPQTNANESYVPLRIESLILPDEPPQTKLPLIDLNLKELCHHSSDFLSGRKGIVGYTYAYDFARLSEAAVEKGENLDGYLSKAILRGMSDHPVKGKLLFFYAPLAHLIFLSVASHSLKARCDFLHEVRGYSEYGQEFVRDEAKPFMLWDGGNLHRLYQLPKDYNPEGFYISDLCSGFGITIEETSEETYQRTATDRAGSYESSAVPTQHEEIVNHNGRKHLLLHSFYRLV
jgi:hypothetical protein